VTDLTYEQALELLDKRLRALEDGSLSLEESLKAYDEAREYLRVCQEKLEAARRRIEVRGEAPAKTAQQAQQEAEQDAAQEDLL
jgi:exodeoxyribonuclease VII small subunit